MKQTHEPSALRWSIHNSIKSFREANNTNARGAVIIRFPRNYSPDRNRVEVLMSSVSIPSLVPVNNARLNGFLFGRGSPSIRRNAGLAAARTGKVIITNRLTSLSWLKMNRVAINAGHSIIKQTVYSNMTIDQDIGFEWFVALRCWIRGHGEE